MRIDRWLPFAYDDGQGNGIVIRHWLSFNDPERVRLDTNVSRKAPVERSKTKEGQNDV